jgi:putative (di)nucleoside polyphosphate hydrolase
VSSRHFRAGVVAVIERDDGAILVFERADAPGSWQLPQGGIERDEEPSAAVWREVAEETGLGPADLELVGELREWIAYAWPPEVAAGRKSIGQVHKWFRFRPAGADVAPSPDGSEFTAWRWVDRNWLVDHVVGFRRDAYRRGLRDGE